MNIDIKKIKKTFFLDEYKGYRIYIDMADGYTIVFPLDARVLMSKHPEKEKLTHKQHKEVAKQMIDAK